MNYLGVTNKAKTQKLFCRERFEKCKSLYRKDLFGHFGCVNAVEFSSDGQWLVSGMYSRFSKSCKETEYYANSNCFLSSFFFPLRGQYKNNIPD